MSTVLLAAAAAVALSGAAFAFSADGVRAGKRVGGFRTILRAPGLQRLLVVAAFYILVLQAVLIYAVPAAREGAEVLYRTSEGPVTVEREVVALQSGRAGQRVFVRTEEGKVLTATVAGPEDAR